MKALLIIDMQKGSFKPYSIRYNAIQTIEQINLLSAKFRELGYPVIYIQHDGTLTPTKYKISVRSTQSIVFNL